VSQQPGQGQLSAAPSGCPQPATRTAGSGRCCQNPLSAPSTPRGWRWRAAELTPARGQPPRCHCHRRGWGRGCVPLTPPLLPSSQLQLRHRCCGTSRCHHRPLPLQHWCIV